MEILWCKPGLRARISNRPKGIVVKECTKEKLQSFDTAKSNKAPSSKEKEKMTNPKQQRELEVGYDFSWTSLDRDIDFSSNL